MKNNRKDMPKVALTPYMENAIFKYESDTFSAKVRKITRTEARLLANRIVRHLVRNNHAIFDGVTLSNELDSIRGR